MKNRKILGNITIGIIIFLVVIVSAIVITIMSINLSKGKDLKNNILQTEKKQNYDDYIKISNIEDYAKMINGEYDLSEKFVLMNDLDLTNYTECIPIGKKTGTSFTGIFDGNNHTITGWNYEMNDSEEESAGFFLSAEFGTIRNLTLKDAELKVTKANKNAYGIGILIGQAEGVLIENCHVYGNINTSDENGVNHVGLFIGDISKIHSDNENTRNINIPEDFIYNGKNVISYIKNCSTSGNINMTNSGFIIGGFVGNVSSNLDDMGFATNITYFENCNTSVNIDITHDNVEGYGGSIAGFLVNAIDVLLYRCYSTGNINAPEQSQGAGFVCKMQESYVDECFSTVDVTVEQGAAGFVYETETFGYIHNYGIKNSYSTGNIVVNEAGLIYYAGTFGGNNKDYLENVYATGKVYVNSEGKSEYESFIGDSYTIADGAYYNSEDVNYTYNYDTYNYIGLTTEQMKLKSSYENFDFENVWSIDEGNNTPYLKFERNMN